MFLGELSECPGYVGVKINDGLAKEELFKYDAFVRCGSVLNKKGFELKFRIPQKKSIQERLFQVFLTDIKKTYTISLASARYIQDEEKAKEKHVYKFTVSSPWNVLTPIIAVASCALLTLAALIIYAECTKPIRYQKADKFELPKWRVGKDAERAEKEYVHSNKLQKRHMVFITWFIIFRVAYSLTFNFTVFLSILSLVHENDLVNLEKFPEFVIEKNIEIKNVSDDMDRHREGDIGRQQNLVGNMQRSCDVLLQDLLNQTRYKISNAVRRTRLQMYDETLSVSRHVYDFVNLKFQEWKRKADRARAAYKQKLRQQIGRVFRKYAQFMRRVRNSGWFAIPRGLSIISKVIGTMLEVLSYGLGLPDLSLGLGDLSFMDFIGVDVFNLQVIPKNLFSK